jgi:pyridoxamine 5'-phosphate oxidase
MTKFPLQDPDPFTIFLRWFREYGTSAKSNYPGACVLSTIGADGFPNARNVSLKLFEFPYLIFGTSMNSPKSGEIARDPKVALTFWWEEAMRQVRIQGMASEVDKETADFLFETRKKSAQLVSHISEQSMDLDSWESLQKSYENKLKNSKDRIVERPATWGGFKVEPVRYEFMEFRESRLHERVLYYRNGDGWETKMIQP